MRIFHSLEHVLGGSFLIAGTTIGVGMLALPIATGEAGFLPSISIYFLCWLFMLCTGLLLLEVCQWMPKDSNLITMAHKLFGPWGKGLCWAVYLFLFITVYTRIGIWIKHSTPRSFHIMTDFRIRMVI